MKFKIFCFLLLLLFHLQSNYAQSPKLLLKDSISKSIDSISAEKTARHYTYSLDSIIRHNQFIQITKSPVLVLKKRSVSVLQDWFFYILISITLTLALIRYFFDKYFNNLIKVILNNTLRQSQLADQLTQAKLPSLLMNMIFIIVGGLYIFMLINHIHINNVENLSFLSACMFGVLLVYLSKTWIVSMIGWMSGYSKEAQEYLFIVWLLNKALAILLLPLCWLIAFSDLRSTESIKTVSFFLLGAIFTVRFIRAFGLLRFQLTMKRFHFFMYLLCVELLPVLLISKSLLIFLNKNL